MRMVDDAVRCENCAHWNKPGEDDENDDKAQIIGVRKCKKAVELWRATEWNADYDRVAKPGLEGQKMFVMDGSSYEANFYTKADFFCAHFEQTPGVDHANG